MSTSLLYHAFGIRGYRYQSTAYEEGAVIFTITQDRLTLRCPECNGRDIICRGVNVRELRTVPIGGKRAYVHIAVQRVWCLVCAAVRQVRLKFAEERVSYESDRIVLKGTRWLLLKNPENLDATRNEQQRLQEAPQINAPLATVYYMREDLQTLWNY